MTRRRLALLTGCPRSGTTALGSLLGRARGVRYLHEPFNFHAGDTVISRYFEVPGAGGFTIARLDDLIDRIRELRLDLRRGIYPQDGIARRVVKHVLGARPRRSLLAARLASGGVTLLWKDPIAALAAGQIAMRHHVPVLVCVRDPLAVAVSFKRLDWSFDLRDIQSRLEEVGEGERGLLQPFADHLEQSVTNAALLWRMIYRCAARWSERTPLVRLIDLDDVLASPVPSFMAMCEHLQLPWTPALHRAVEHTYRVRKPDVWQQLEDIPRRAHLPRRDVLAVNRYGRALLSDAERRSVEQITGALWREIAESPSLLARPRTRATPGAPHDRAGVS